MATSTLVIVILVLIGLFFGYKSIFQTPENDIGEKLRALLLARADGSIGEEEFAQRQAALHAALLQAKPASNRRSWVLAGLVLMSVAALGIYGWRAKSSPPLALPAPGPLDTEFGKTEAAKPPMNVGGDLNVMVKRLADKMAKNPDDGDGWLLLARTYTEINQPKDAAAAYAKAAALLPPNATLLADWANAYVVSHGGKWDAEAKKIVQRALAADPKHIKTLSLAGTEAYERADYKTAIDYWKRMQAASEAGSMDAKLAAANIQEAEALRSGKAPKPAAAAAQAIAGTVSLDERLKAQVAPGDTVFVVARAPDGSNPPLAVKRFTVADLPAHFTLDDSSAMVPSRTLSNYGEVTLLARISKSGQAMPAAGDIEAKPVTAKLGSGDVKLNLSVVR